MSTATDIARDLGLHPFTVSSLSEKLGVGVTEVPHAVATMRPTTLVLLGNFRGPQGYYLFHFAIEEACQQIKPVLVYELEDEPQNLYLSPELADITGRFLAHIKPQSQVGEDRLELLGRYFPPTRLEIIYSRFKEHQPDSVENIFQAVLTDMFGDCEDLTLLGDFVTQAQALDLAIRLGLANNPPTETASLSESATPGDEPDLIQFDEPVEVPHETGTVYLACDVVVDPSLGQPAKDLKIGDHLIVKIVDNSEQGLFLAHLMGAVHQREVRPMAAPIERAYPGNEAHPETTFLVRFGPGAMGEVKVLPEMLIAAVKQGQMPVVQDPEEYREVYTYRQYQAILMCLGGVASVLLLLLAYYLVGTPA